MLVPMHRLLITATLLVSVDASAGCETPADVADLTATLDRIDAAYQSADTVAYTSAMAKLGPQLDCSSEVLPRSLIARVHRTQGLAAFTQQDGERLTQAFAAAKAIEPAFTFPVSFVPASHPLAQKYADVQASDGTIPLPPLSSGFLLLDGEAADARPTERAVVLQHIVGRNEVALTRYLLADDRSWAQLTPAETAPVPTSGTGARPFWIASIASASLSAITYGVGASRRSAYEKAEPADKPGLRTQTNSLVQASVGLAGVAAGTAVVGVVVAR